MSVTSGLSNKPSEALHQAITDFEMIENDPRFQVSMSDWCDVTDGVCYVCLAGAVIAGRILRQGKMVKKSMTDYTVDHKMRGIDMFRVGRLWDGVEYFKLDEGQWTVTTEPKPIAGLPAAIDVCKYSHDADQFKRQIREIIAMLQGVGL